MKKKVILIVAMLVSLAVVSWDAFNKRVEREPQHVMPIKIENNSSSSSPTPTIQEVVNSFDPPEISVITIPEMPIDSIKTIIKPITSGGKQLQAEVHWSSSSCIGYVLIIRPDCRDTTTVISTNDKWNSYLKSIRGPDWFRVNIEGDDVTFMITLSYINNCKYIALIPKVMSSNLRVTIKWETDNYLGTSEMVQTVTSFREKYLTRATTFGSCNNNDIKINNKGLYHKGRKGFERSTQRYQWSHPIKGIEWVWDNGLESTTRCTNKTIIFIGDSQIRSTWRHWVGMLKRKPPELAKAFMSDEVHLYSHRVAFFFDPFMERLFSENVTKVINNSGDGEVMIVFGFGAWAANIIPGWSHQRYVTAVTSIFDRISKSNQPNLRYIWLGTPTWPKPRRNSEGFRITNARLSLWNQIASKLAKSVGIQVIDFYGISYPHIKMNRDQIHFDNSIIMYSVVEQIANSFCNPIV